MLHWDYRKNSKGADACDPERLIVIQVEPVLSRTRKSVAGYEWYAWRIDDPEDHKQIATSDHYYKKHRPFKTRKAAIEAANNWHQEFIS